MYFLIENLKKYYLATNAVQTSRYRSKSITDIDKNSNIGQYYDPSVSLYLDSGAGTGSAATRKHFRGAKIF